MFIGCFLINYAEKTFILDFSSIVLNSRIPEIWKQNDF